MLILMHRQATREEVANVVAQVRERGYQPVELPGTDRLAIGVLGSNPSRIRDAVAALPGVVEAIPSANRSSRLPANGTRSRPW